MSQYYGLIALTVLVSLLMTVGAFATYMNRRRSK